MNVDMSPAWGTLGRRPIEATPFPEHLIPLQWMGWTHEGASRALNGCLRLGIVTLGDLRLICKDCLLLERYMGDRTVNLLEGAALGLGYPLATTETCVFCKRKAAGDE